MRDGQIKPPRQAGGGMVVDVKALQGTKLILVDDEAGILRALALILSSLKCEVSAFGSPVQALEHLDTGAVPDAIISDLRMPEMSGIEFLQALRSRGSTIPFVLMSGHATAEDVDMARRAGITAFLGKPFPPQELLKVLTTLLPRLRSAGNE